MELTTVYYIVVGMSSSTARLVGKAGPAAVMVSGGWNLHGHSDTAFPLVAAPTVTWESQRGLIAVFLF